MNSIMMTPCLHRDTKQRKESDRDETEEVGARENRASGPPMEAMMTETKTSTDHL